MKTNSNLASGFVQSSQPIVFAISEPGRPSKRPVDTESVYRQASSGLPCWITDTTGARRPLPMGRWLGGASSTPHDRAVDELLLGLCLGPTMDVGCGPGRFTAALADRGLPALGVDVSATAVDMTLRRGGMALHR